MARAILRSCGAIHKVIDRLIHLIGEADGPVKPGYLTNMLSKAQRGIADNCGGIAALLDQAARDGRLIKTGDGAYDIDPYT